MERSSIAVEERHIHFPAAAFVVGVAVEGDLDLPVALGNGRITDRLVENRDRHKLALELHPFLMRNQLGLGIVLNVHVVHRQIRRAARDDLLKNACAQRVKVQPASVYGIFTWTPLRSEMDESSFSTFVSVTAAFVPRTRTL